MALEQELVRAQATPVLVLGLAHALKLPPQLEHLIVPQMAAV